MTQGPYGGRIQAIQWNNRLKTGVLMLWFVAGIVIFVCLLLGTVLLPAAAFDLDGVWNYMNSEKFFYKFSRVFLKVLLFSFLGAFYFMHTRIKHAAYMFDALPLDINHNHPFYRALENLCIARGLKTPDLYMTNQHPELVTAVTLQGFSNQSTAILTRAVFDLPPAQQEALAAQIVQRLYSKDTVFLTFFCFLGYFPYHMLDAVGKFRKIILKPFLKIVDWILRPVRPLVYDIRSARIDAGSLGLTKDKESMLHLIERLPQRATLTKYYDEPYLALFLMRGNTDGREQSLNAALR